MVIVTDDFVKHKLKIDEYANFQHLIKNSFSVDRVRILMKNKNNILPNEITVRSNVIAYKNRLFYADTGAELMEVNG